MRTLGGFSKGKAKSVFLGKEDEYFLSVVDESGTFHTWNINIDQVIQLAYQSIDKIKDRKFKIVD